MATGKRFFCGRLNAEVTQGLCLSARAEAHRRIKLWPEIMGWMQVCLQCDRDMEKALRKRLPKYLYNATPAVRRDYGF